MNIFAAMVVSRCSRRAAQGQIWSKIRLDFMREYAVSRACNDVLTHTGIVGGSIYSLLGACATPSFLSFSFPLLSPLLFSLFLFGQNSALLHEKFARMHACMHTREAPPAVLLVATEQTLVLPTNATNIGTSHWRKSMANTGTDTE
jgi:hypothetical protein